MEYRGLHTLSVPGLPFQQVVKVLGEPSAVVAPSSSSDTAGGGTAAGLPRTPRKDKEKEKVLRSKGFSRVLVG